MCHFSLQFLSLLTHRNAVTGHAHNECVVLEVHCEVFNWSLFGSECIVSPCICNLQGMLLVTDPLLISFSEWERWGSFRLSLKWPLSNELRSHLGPIINELFGWLRTGFPRYDERIQKANLHNPVASSKPSLTFWWQKSYGSVEQHFWHSSNCDMEGEHIRLSGWMNDWQKIHWTSVCFLRNMEALK